MDFGIVRFFNASDGKNYGFLEVAGGSDVFFHYGDYRAHDGSDRQPNRIPQRGDRVAFTKASGSGGRPKASPWLFANEVPPNVNGNKPMTIRLDDVPSINCDKFQEGDLVVHEVDQGGSNPIYWDAIILRPSTGEIFKIRCRDGENSGYFPDLPSGSLPEGVVVQK